jgi:hypothetical protein
MNDLLTMALEAHGGLDRWNQLKALRANLSVTGALWHRKNRPDILKDISIEAQLHEERVATHLIGRNKRMLFTPDQVAIETEDGQLVERRDHPRSSFAGHDAETPWDDLHVAYFSSYALWTYLTIPFVYTYPGVVTEELPPWHEDGEEWRPLKVVFPDGIATHTREQISYFGQDGLLRRHEYTVDIIGGGRGLNYASKYRNAGGIMVPTERRVYPPDAQRRKVPSLVLVAIDIHDIEFVPGESSTA